MTNLVKNYFLTESLLSKGRFGTVSVDQLDKENGCTCLLEEGVIPSGEFVNDVSGLAEVFVVVGEVHLWPDQAQVQLVVDPALPEPGVEEGSLVAGIGADKQDLWVSY